MDSNWIEYKCNSGQTMFVYDKLSREHKWPTNVSTEENCSSIFIQPVVYKEVSSIGTQTDANGCNNGCTSMYITSNTHNGTVTQGQLVEVQIDNPESGYCISNRANKTNMESAPCIIAKEDGNDSKYLVDFTNKNSVERASDSVSNKDRYLNVELQKGDKDDAISMFEHNHGITNSVDIRSNKMRIEHELQEESDIQSVEKLANGSNNKTIAYSISNQDSTLSMGSILQEGREVNHESTDNLVQVKQSTRDLKGVKCTYCDKKFKFQCILKRHLRTHTGEKPFECSYCDKKFSHNNRLKEHLRAHTGEEPFECTFCAKKFSRKDALQSHLRGHAEVPKSANINHECPYCKKTFMKKSALTIHVRMHTGERPFECSYCSKKFIQKSDVTIHLRTHTGEKPFECSYCKKRFSQKANLKDHLRTHTGEKPFECPRCPMKFAHKTNVTKHLRTHFKFKA